MGRITGENEMATRDQVQPKPSHQTTIEWREVMGFTQDQAAAELGCSRTAFGGWERAPATLPKYIKLAMAALALGIKAD
jgi:transcriptional regulator with XRE-family HTH domain